ncbi:MAG TPA: VCBS repeat-containing protein [Chryseosolibacter sp.]
MKNFKDVLVLAALLAMISCSERNDTSTLFQKISSDKHGIDFQNTITENDTLNILSLEYIYNGGGVAVADFNNDGLRDVFLSGNMVPNKLYLNEGNFTFKDVSATAQIGAASKWKSAVAIADINADGWKDIYVCATILPDSSLRENMLFIHKGLNDHGEPVFEDQAKAYGVNYAGHSSGAAFLDYDNDGDLDLFIITNTILRGVPTTYRPKITDGTTNADVLLRNNGDGSFANVSQQAGILDEGYGLGVAIADINQDGWQDIYVSNDYITNDLMYINNGDGTFTNDIDKCIKHQSMFSMGNDIADFNNDGYPDIITLDMLPEGNLRRKTVIGGTGYSSYINNERYGYAHQYIRNALQLNNGDGTFSEIGQLAGVHQTEWSWSPLFVDVDNDGNRDLLVTNGFPKDITDKDFANFRAETMTLTTLKDQMDSIPVVKIANYAFRNNGNLTFKDVTAEWGLTDRSFSNGASFADFDNDGDVDYIVNNINDGILLYENTLYDNDQRPDSVNHFLRIRLNGPPANSVGLGAKIKLYYGNGKLQYHDQSVYRGYISSVEDIIHFGIGKTTHVDSIIVEWLDQKRSKITSTPADQLLTIDHKNARPFVRKAAESKATLLVESTAQRKINFVHQEEDKVDFNVQRTIPHKFSQTGPALAVGDVNGDGLDDLYHGGSAHFDGALFLQNRNGSFSVKTFPKSPTRDEEDQGALFFDADNDGDLDLYVVSGSFEFPIQHHAQQDRLYINDSKGNFKLDPSRLPETLASGSCVRASDFDQDGDLDLFVGGKVIPAQYPFPSESYLLVNDKGKFTKQTEHFAPGLASVGIVNDALWTDINNDNKPDLMIAGEFMALTIFVNDGQKLTQLNDTGLEAFTGWWNSLLPGDFDNDGDTDYIAGNLGQNNLYRASSDMPLRVYAKDFDGNNSIDAVLSCYLLSEQGDRKEFPVHFWEELNSQSPKFRRQFKYYKKFGVATLDKILSEEDRKDALVLTATWTSTSYIENAGNGKFKVVALPTAMQTAPVNGMVSVDVNDDGHLDVVMVGNDFGNEVNTGRYDAFNGAIMRNNGKGRFELVRATETGFKVPGDAKALVRLHSNGPDLIAASQNRGELKLFTITARDHQTLKPLFDDRYAEITLTDGSKRRVEFYYGSGYLSQSSRVLTLPLNVAAVSVTNTKGEVRQIAVGKKTLALTR